MLAQLLNRSGVYGEDVEEPLCFVTEEGKERGTTNFGRQGFSGKARYSRGLQPLTWQACALENSSSQNCKTRLFIFSENKTALLLPHTRSLVK